MTHGLQREPRGESQAEPASLVRAREIVKSSLGAHPPPGLLRLESRLRVGDASARELARLVEGSPALAARVLRLANSAMFSPIEPVLNLPRAVAMIGNVVLRQLVLTALVMLRGAGNRSPRQIQAADRVMGDSIRSAVIARHLASLSGLAQPDDAFAAGLVHDLGQIYVLDAVGDTYAEYLLKLAGDLRAESELAGTTHVEVGAALAQDWQLPKPLEVVLSAHHVAVPDPLTRVVAAADRIVPDVDWTDPRDESIGSPTIGALMELRADRRRWPALLPSLRREVTDLFAVFEVK